MSNALIRAENLLHSIEADASNARLGLARDDWRSVHREMLRWNIQRMRALLEALDSCVEQIPGPAPSPPVFIGERLDGKGEP